MGKFGKLHAEEARSTDHDKSPEELHGEAPPCKKCGEKPREQNSDYCEDCDPEPGS